MGYGNLEWWFEPWLGKSPMGGGWLVAELPAQVALAGLEGAGLVDDGPCDGLPSAIYLARTALCIHQDARLRGMLLDVTREDARLHIDTIDLPGEMPRESILACVEVLLSEEIRPDSVEQVADGSVWRLWWD